MPDADKAILTFLAIIGLGIIVTAPNKWDDNSLIYLTVLVAFWSFLGIIYLIQKIFGRKVE